MRLLTKNNSIVFFTTDSKPLTGGIAEYLHQLCKHLGALNIEVELYSTVPNCLAHHTENYTMKKLERRPVRQVGQQWGDKFFLTRKANTYAYYKSLERTALEEIRCVACAPHMIVIGYWSPESHFWCKACRLLKVPYIIICYGAELLNNPRWPSARWRRKDLMDAAHVVVISYATGELVKKIAGRDVAYRVVHPGVCPNNHSMPDDSTLQKKRCELDIPEDANIILTLGRLVKRKGADLVIESLASLAPMFPKLYYIVVGDGPEKQNLQNKACSLGVADRVIFLPDVSDSEKWVFYFMSDIFVMPNRTLGGTDWEGFGIVFLEAALAGKPSIGGNNGGVPDAIVHGKTGLLVETDHYKETAESIKHLLQDVPKRLAMGKTAWERATNSFNWIFLAKSFADQVLFEKECVV